MSVGFLLFEVMDKMPPLSAIWLFTLIAGVGGFLLAQKHPAFLFLVFPIVFSFASLIISEINDPSIGYYIIQEAGYGYIVQSYIAIIIATLLPTFGVFAWLWQKRKRSFA